MKKKPYVKTTFDSELDLELHCCELAFNLYGLWNLKQDTSKGLPDRLFFKTNKLFFVEFKDYGRKAKKYQQHVQEQLRKSGVGVYTDIDSVEKFMEICDAELRT